MTVISSTSTSRPWLPPRSGPRTAGLLQLLDETAGAAVADAKLALQETDGAATGLLHDAHCVVKQIVACIFFLHALNLREERRLRQFAFGLDWSRQAAAGCGFDSARCSGSELARPVHWRRAAGYHSGADPSSSGRRA